ncbi:MAG: cation:proton antiporter [Candidatus Comchoanobacterales bacterium]
MAASLALFSRQSLLISYIIIGFLFGPFCGRIVTSVGLQNDLDLIAQMANLGLKFLLFLLALHLDPHSLIHSLKKTSLVTMVSSLVFALMGAGFAWSFGFSGYDILVISLVAMFSSTILCLKLMPTQMLHHRPIGEMMISILLFQDILAILAIMVVDVTSKGNINLYDMLFPVVALPVMVWFSFAFERFVILPMMIRFERSREYLFVLSIGWCFFMVVLAEQLGIEPDIGAFLAGVSIASSSRISHYLAESLRPLRDFFLVVFFWHVGATYNLWQLDSTMIFNIIIFSAAIYVIKPLVFRVLCGISGEERQTSWELGFRLGQGSEFSLLLLALANGVSQNAQFLIKGSVIISFVLSSYHVAKFYRTPDAIKQDRDI